MDFLIKNHILLLALSGECGNRVYWRSIRLMGASLLMYLSKLLSRLLLYLGMADSRFIGIAFELRLLVMLRNSKMPIITGVDVWVMNVLAGIGAEQVLYIIKL